MSRRKRRSAPRDPFDPTRKRRQVGQVPPPTVNGTISKLGSPNQLVSTAVTGRNYYPLMGVQIVHSGQERASPAFIHPRYGSYYTEAWHNAAPSWMDPQLFADMARKDSKVQQLLQEAVTKNDRQPRRVRALAKELDRIFREYQQWVKDRYGQVRELVAEWLILNAADRKLEQEEAETRAATYRRKKKTARRKKKAAV